MLWRELETEITKKRGPDRELEGELDGKLEGELEGELDGKLESDLERECVIRDTQKDILKMNKHFEGSCELLSLNLILMLTSC